MFQTTKQFGLSTKKRLIFGSYSNALPHYFPTSQTTDSKTLELIFEQTPLIDTIQEPIRDPCQWYFDSHLYGDMFMLGSSIWWKNKCSVLAACTYQTSTHSNPKQFRAKHVIMYAYTNYSVYVGWWYAIYINLFQFTAIKNTHKRNTWGRRGNQTFSASGN